LSQDLGKGNANLGIYAKRSAQQNNSVPAQQQGRCARPGLIGPGSSTRVSASISGQYSRENDAIEDEEFAKAIWFASQTAKGKTRRPVRRHRWLLELWKYHATTK